MFTGIIETMGQIVERKTIGQNLTLFISSPLAAELKVDQSVSHNGICLTVESITGNMHQVTAIHETLLKSNIASWQTGDVVNLERCMQMNGRIDGHIVQGHVDSIGTCINFINEEGSWRYTFQFPQEFAHLIVEKGSVAVSGVSLTVIDALTDTFQVAIIPYTFEHTIFKNIKKGSTVNLEFDIIGKYVARGIYLKNQ